MNENGTIINNVAGNKVANVFEVISTISGEVGAIPAGTKILIVRFKGCNLCCSYCDTPLSRERDYKEAWVTVEDMVNKINRKAKILNIKHIMFTGGEPLLQAEFMLAVIEALEKENNGYTYTVETNGSISPDAFLPNVMWLFLIENNRLSFVVDIKLDMICKQAYVASMLSWFCSFLMTFTTPVLRKAIIFKIPIKDVEEVKEAVDVVTFFCRESKNIVGGDYVIPYGIFFSPIISNGVVLNSSGVPDNKTMIDLIEKVVCKPLFGQCEVTKGLYVGLNFQLHKILNVN